MGVISGLIAFSCRRPWLVTLMALALCAGALVYAAGHFAMTTDTAELISSKTEWRRHEAAIDSAFPQRTDQIVVVVDGQTSELAESAAAALADRLSARRDLVRRVSRPDGGPFFAQNGLMLLSPSPVWDTGTLITEFAYSRLLSVTRNPSLVYGKGYAGCPTNDRKDGCATRDFLGVAISFTPQWLEVMPGTIVGLPMFVNYGIKGNNAGLGGGFQGAVSYAFGVEADVRQTYYFSLKYNGSYNRPQPVNAPGFFSSGSGTFMQNNRGWVSLTFKTSF